LSLALAALCVEEPGIQRMAQRIIHDVFEQTSQVEELVGLRMLLASCLVHMHEGPLPQFLAVFYARAAPVVVDPVHFMYTRMSRLLCKNAVLPRDNLPLFNTLQSTMADYTAHSKRQQQVFLDELGWMVDVLEEGYGESSVTAYEKMHVFEIATALLHLTSSPTSYSATSSPAIRTSLVRLLFRLSDEHSLERHSLAAVCLQDIAFNSIGSDCRTAMLARAAGNRLGQHHLEFSVI